MQVFKNLLESAEFLTEEAKQELIEAMDVIVEEAKQTATDEVQVALREQWATERDALVEALDLQVRELFESELKELTESVDEFYDLQADYELRLVEARQGIEETFRQEFKENREELIEQLDSFLQIAIEEEVEELREELAIANSNKMGRRIMEAFLAEYREFYVPEDSLEAKLVEAQAQIEDLSAELETVESDRDAKERQIKISEALAPLTGQAREVMSALLESTATDKIEVTYDRLISRVLKESTGSEKEPSSAQVLAENAGSKSTKTLEGNPGKTLIQEQLEAGNYKQTVNESDSGLSQWRKLSGLN